MTLHHSHLKMNRKGKMIRKNGAGSSVPRGAIPKGLLDMSYEDRVANPCIGAERADLVLAGCAIFEAIRRAFPCQRLRVADRGLREGMLVQMMREDGVWDALRVEP